MFRYRLQYLYLRRNDSGALRNLEHKLLFYLILFILIAQYAVDMLLAYLNAQKFHEPVPHVLEDVFDGEEYRKSKDYKKENYRFGLFSDTFSLVLTLAFLIFGGFEWLDQWIRQISDNLILQALCFFGLLALASNIVGIPFSYYQTFGIEEKYGFNKTTPQTFFKDILKGWLLAGVLSGGVLALVIWFLQWSGPYFLVVRLGHFCFFNAFLQPVLQQAYRTAL